MCEDTILIRSVSEGGGNDHSRPKEVEIQFEDRTATGRHITYLKNLLKSQDLNVNDELHQIVGPFFCLCVSRNGSKLSPEEVLKILEADPKFDVAKVRR